MLVSGKVTTDPQIPPVLTVFFFAPKKNHPPALHAPWYCNTATPPRAAGATCMKSRCLCSCDEQIFLQGKPTKKQGKSPNKQCKPNKNEDFRYIPLPKSDDFVAPRPLKKRSRWQHQVIQEKWHAQALYQSYFRASATSILTLRCYIWIRLTWFNHRKSDMKCSNVDFLLKISTSTCWTRFFRLTLWPPKWKSWSHTTTTRATWHHLFHNCGLFHAFSKYPEPQGIRCPRCFRRTFVTSPLH